MMKTSLTEIKAGKARGFSIIELLVAMTLTLIITGVASTLLARTMNLRTRTNANADALADAQRALNIMSREIANAGFNLSDNGIVAGDSINDSHGNSTLRIRANLNKFNLAVSAGAQAGIGTVVEDAGEDVEFLLYAEDNNNLLARYDAYATAGGKSTVLANRLDSLHVHYYSQKVTYGASGCDITGASSSEVNPQAATYVVLAVCVHLSAVGKLNGPGYQPPTSVLLVSDIALRNSNLPLY
jgi:prepilin-type N-terminal cleavage/methylation domain-containing protein